jgi:putative flippase GtrA
MKHFLKQFTQVDAHPAIQFIKYSIAGGVATAVHISLFYTLASTLFPALTADDFIARLLHLPAADVSVALRARNSMIDNVIAFVFSNFTAYILNILWVFKRGRHHWLVEVGMFYAVSAVSIVIGTSVMGALIRYFGLTTTVAFSANLVSALFINYGMRKFVIFKG